MRTSPAAFRERLRLSDDDERTFGDLMQPWQARDFRVLDAAWRQLAGVTHTAPYQRAYIERPRGHGKTSDMAVQIAWILLFARRTVEGLAAAADRDQANLLWDAVRRIARLNPLFCGELVFHRHRITNPRTGSRLEVISSDVGSSWGALPDFVICDELCHWERPDLWHSLASSAAKKPGSVLAVLTNAGVGRGWQWFVREAARTSPGWYFSSLDGAQAPWIRPEWLAEQERLLPRPVYERLWQNIWQHSDGEFVTLADAEACRDASLSMQSRGQPHRQYIAAVDYAEKHDLTVGVVLHRDGPRLVVDRMDVAAPRHDAPVKVAWVEAWMRQIAADFHAVTYVLDEYQLLGTIQTLEPLYTIRRFAFQGGRGNHALALALRRLILHREVVWYSGCGQIADVPQRDDIETELAALLLRQSASGRCRLDHRPGGQHHDDRAFALGAACLHALEQTAGPEWLHVMPPNAAGGFAW